jgi:hypothetical protein
MEARMSRKYKQKGYQDGDSERPARPRPAANGEFVRGRVETRYRRTIRCAECSANAQFMDELKPTDTCRGCNADLRTCRNCKFFDPGAPNECMQPVPRRIDGKNVRNECPLFKPKILFEKAVEEKREGPVNDARKAFDDLFKI